MQLGASSPRAYELLGLQLYVYLILRDGAALPYDHLIVAAGATHSYFGRDEWATHAPGLKTLDDAFDIRRRILLAFEVAEKEDDPARRAAWLNFVVVGGGPTGVEMAGTLAEIARAANAARASQAWSAATFYFLRYC